MNPGAEYPTPGPKDVGHDCGAHAAAEAVTVIEAVPVRLQPDRVPVSTAVAHCVPVAPTVGQEILVKKSVTTPPEHELTVCVIAAVPVRLQPDRVEV